MATVQENALLVFDDTKPGLIENSIFEGTDCLKAALSSGLTSLQVMVALARNMSSGSMKL